MKSILTFLLLGYLTSDGDHGGKNPAWERHAIDPADAVAGKSGADGVRLADVNRDRLPDVVTGWENGNAIRICLNPGPGKVRLPWPAVTVGRVTDAEDAIFTDLDGDLAIDVVSACEGKTQSIFVHWAPGKNAAYLDEKLWKTAAFPCTEKAAQWMYLHTMDVDRDGDADIVAGSKNRGGSIGWLVNPGHRDARNVSLWKWIPLVPAGWIMGIQTIDLDGDGHKEIVYSDRKGEHSGVYAMSHLTTEPWLSAPVLLGFGGKEVMFLDVADVDGDGKKDIAAAIRPRDFGLLLQPSANPWRAPWKETTLEPLANRDLFGESKAVKIADLDQDGRLDVAVTCEHAKGEIIGVFQFPLPREGDRPSSLRGRNIGGKAGVKFDRIELIDLDQDGDLDLMTCEETEGLGVVWYENPHR